MNHLSNLLTENERNTYFQFAKLNLPRHTSYPSSNHWTKSTDSNPWKRELGAIVKTGRPLSVYVHVPFCEKLCHYCGCNKLIISRNNEDSDAFAKRYLQGIEQELTHLSTADRWNVQQIHFGGGTPTWLKPHIFTRLWDLILKNVNLSPSAEVSIELDPRVTTTAHLQTLRDLGFNRISLGVQDFDSNVQSAIERIQPFEMVKNFVDECRNLGLNNINFDLIYGLPRQTRHSMSQTLEKVCQLSPDRIAFYRLALMPEVFKWQRTFQQSEIPDDDSVLDMMLMATKIFQNHNYQFIGLDHFAKATDELSRSMLDGTLKRSFQGMTTGDVLPVIGLGPSAISSTDNFYHQNEPVFQSWTRKVAEDIPTVKHYKLSDDDLICRWCINQLYCYRKLDKDLFEATFHKSFDLFFSDRLAALTELETLNIILLDQRQITLKPYVGWLLLRVVAAVFDKFLGPEDWKIGLPSGVASRVG